jgi:hypothetical protein
MKRLKLKSPYYNRLSLTLEFRLSVVSKRIVFETRAVCPTPAGI